MVTIALMGTFDTKGRELLFVREKLTQLGARVRLIDLSTLHEGGENLHGHLSSPLAGRRFEEVAAMPKAEAAEVVIEGA